MIKESIKEVKKASEAYILKNEYEITENILKYIETRIQANEQEITELIEITKEKITYKEIEEVIKQEIAGETNYKDYRKMEINKENFISVTIKMPVEIIAVEAYDIKEVIKYYIKAIKTRNGIVISDIEYEENSVKNLILLIIKEALKKYGIEENLIKILPYEDCLYKYFDEVIYTYGTEGELLKEEKVEKKESTEKLYIYIEEKELEEIAKENKEGEVIRGEIEEAIEEAIETINKTKSKGAVIYTRDSPKAYEFINLVKSKNVFVNTSLENIKEVKECTDNLYEYKNIIVPIPQERIEEIKEETGLTVIKEESILQKIKDWLKHLFK